MLSPRYLKDLLDDGAVTPDIENKQSVISAGS
jgi:hypothetical protein